MEFLVRNISKNKRLLSRKESEILVIVGLGFSVAVNEARIIGFLICCLSS